jgi:hypothetical protein
LNSFSDTLPEEHIIPRALCKGNKEIQAGSLVFISIAEVTPGKIGVLKKHLRRENNLKGKLFTPIAYTGRPVREMQPSVPLLPCLLDKNYCLHNPL